MKRVKHTKNEEAYKRFDKISKMAIYSLSLLMLLCIVLFLACSEDEYKLLFGILLLICTAFIVAASSYITNKRNRYLRILANERACVVRRGILNDIYEAYCHDGFESNLIYDKMLHEEYYNNAIDMVLQKNQHEFLIEIDGRTMSIIVDEETNHPIAKEWRLADISSMQQVYQTINTFLEKYS